MNVPPLPRQRMRLGFTRPTPTIYGYNVRLTGAEGELDANYSQPPEGWQSELGFTLNALQVD